MKRLLLLLCVFAALALGQSPTRVSQVINRADTTASAGTVTISWDSFTYSGRFVGKNTKTVTLPASGLLTVDLYPYSGYTVKYNLANNQSTEYWSVPVSGSPVTINSVRTSALPTPASLIGLSWITPCPAGQVIGTPSGGGPTGCVAASGITSSAQQVIVNTGSGPAGVANFTFDPAASAATVTGNITITNTGTRGYSLFGQSTATVPVNAARDVFYFGTSFNGIATAGSRGLTVVHEFDSNTDNSNAHQGIDVQAIVGTGFTANLTSVNHGGGLLNEFNIQHHGSGVIAMGSGINVNIQSFGTGTFTDTGTFVAESPSIPVGINWGSNSAFWAQHGVNTFGTFTRAFGVRVDSLSGGTDACAGLTGNWGACLNDQSYFGKSVTGALSQASTSVSFSFTGSQPVFLIGSTVTFSGGGSGVVIDGRALVTPGLVGTLIVHATGAVSGTITGGNCSTTATCTITGTQSVSGATGVEIVGSANLSSQVLYMQGVPFLSYFAPSGSRGRNVFVGYGAGNFTMGDGSTTNGTLNVALGSMALTHNTLGVANLALGDDSLYANLTGNQNVSVGGDAMQQFLSGDNNTAVGKGALSLATATSETTAIGWGSLAGLTTGNTNTALGAESGRSITTGTNNLVLSAGFTGDNGQPGITTGSGNVVIGSVIGLSPTLTNSVVISDGVGNIRMSFDSGGIASITAGLLLGNTSDATPLLARYTGTGSHDLGITNTGPAQNESILVYPSTTSVSSALTLYNGSDVLNAGALRFRSNGSAATVQSITNGSGTPITTHHFGEASGSALTHWAIDFGGVTKFDLTPATLTLGAYGAGVANFNSSGLLASTQPPASGAYCWMSANGAMSWAACSGGVSAGVGRYDSSGNLTASELSGDCTTSGSNAVTCTKTNGVSFSTVATSGSASDLSTGTLAVARLSPASKIRAIGVTFDGGGSALTAGLTKYLTVPFGCTISAWNFAVDTGTATVKTWKVATGTAIPTVSNTISTSGVAISSGTAIHSTTLSDFTTTAVAANDIFAFNLFAVSSATQANFILECNQ